MKRKQSAVSVVAAHLVLVRRLDTVSNDSTSRPKDLATRAFSNAWFAIGWVVFLAVVVTRFWRVRDTILVWWVYGRDAYFRDGVRVLPGKPVRFTTGELAPQWPDIVTGFGFFLVVAGGLTLFLILSLRVYERLHNSGGIA